MRKLVLISISLFVVYINAKCQNEDSMISTADSNDFYYEIPAYPESYTAENVAARMIDGLGFRFYWASEGLRQSDLDFRPSDDGRTTEETLDHLHGLSLTIINATFGKVNESTDRSGMTTDDKRKKTLENIRAASENLKKAAPGDIENMKSIFKRGEGNTAEFPFWNMINGPIADAIYHTGQIVTFRRSSGNPINPNITVFMGRLRN